MSRLQLRGVFGALDLDIPLEALVVVSGPGETATRLTFGLIAEEARRKMAPLLAPSWLPAASRVAPTEAGEVHGLRPTFVFRHAEAAWEANARVGDVLGLLSLLAVALGVPSRQRCVACSGAGHIASVNADSLVADPMLSLEKGAIPFWYKKNSQFYLGVLKSLAVDVGVDLTLPWRELPTRIKDVVLFGNTGSNYRGVVYDVERRLARAGEGRGTDSIANLSPYLKWQDCRECGGTGLEPLRPATPMLGITWARIFQTPIAEITTLADDILPVGHERVRRALATQVETAKAFGLGAMPVGQRATELSGAAKRQLRLAEVLGSGLRGALFVLESPLAEFEDSVRASALEFMRELVAEGDSILIASACPTLARECDWRVELEQGAEPGSVRLAVESAPDRR